MNIRKLIPSALVGATLFAGAFSYGGENDVLLKLLVQKGIITQQEAATVNAELTAAAAEEREEIKKEITSASESKLSLGKGVEKLKLYGDVRLRYQYEDAQDQTHSIDEPDPNKRNHNERNRYRYRARVGATYNFDSPWSAGIRLESNNASDSTNVDLGGFFDKDGDEVYFGLIYLEYDDAFNLRIGKHKHPFLLSKAFWDSDINPEGFSEQISFADVLGDWDITLRSGQYIIDDERDSRSETDAGFHTSDDFMFVGQVEGKAKVLDGTLKLAPTLMVTTGGQTSAGTAESGNTPSNENASSFFHDFTVIALPFDYQFKGKRGVAHKIFGTYGINLDGDDLIKNSAFGDGSRSQNQFFNLGYQYGKAKKAGSWQAGIEYRFIEAASYSPNLSDSDFGKNALNQQGLVLSCKYAFTDWLFGAVTYFGSNDIDDGIDTSVSGNNSVDVLQVDLNWKF